MSSNLEWKLERNLLMLKEVLVFSKAFLGLFQDTPLLLIEESILVASLIAFSRSNWLIEIYTFTTNSEIIKFEHVSTNSNSQHQMFIRNHNFTNFMDNTEYFTWKTVFSFYFRKVVQIAAAEYLNLSNITQHTDLIRRFKFPGQLLLADTRFLALWLVDTESRDWGRPVIGQFPAVLVDPVRWNNVAWILPSTVGFKFQFLMIFEQNSRHWLWWEDKISKYGR